jgi:hypothetical protein
MYYVLTKTSSPSESWTFTTRERALQFVENRLCWGCKQDVRSGIVTEHNPENDKLETIVVQDALDTHCGEEYTIQQITQDEYRARAEKAMQEITKIFENDYNKEHDEDLSEKNVESNRVD